MIGERTKMLFKLWGTGASDRPKSMKTMDSYCSHISNMFPEGLDLTINGIIRPIAELSILCNSVGALIGNLNGDARSAMRSMGEFIQWLIDEEKSGVQFGVLLEDLKHQSQYSFSESFHPLFNAFGIDQDKLIDYSMNPEVSFFASAAAALESWNELTGKLLGGQTVVIRNKNELFRLFYSQVFNNEHVVGDYDGNTAPIKALSAVTRVSTRADFLRRENGNRLLINYKLSHIYARPNNPLMFSGVYNIAFTPTLIDAFTEEVEGEFAIRFRRVFRAFAHQRFGQIYLRFKEFVAANDIHAQIDAFNPPGFTQRQLMKFRQIAHADWSPIFEIPD